MVQVSAENCLAPALKFCPLPTLSPRKRCKEAPKNLQKSKKSQEIKTLRKQHQAAHRMYLNVFTVVSSDHSTIEKDNRPSIYWHLVKQPFGGMGLHFGVWPCRWGAVARAMQPLLFFLFAGDVSYLPQDSVPLACGSFVACLYCCYLLAPYQCFISHFCGGLQLPCGLWGMPGVHASRCQWLAECFCMARVPWVPPAVWGAGGGTKILLGCILSTIPDFLLTRLEGRPSGD